ncbi:RHS repeat-associated core domain-containing protein [Sorangium sp. So ce134]
MARTAPVPNIPAIPGMNPGVFVLGGGGNGSGSGGRGGGGTGKDQGSNGSSGGDDASGGGKSACGGGGDGSGCPNHHGSKKSGKVSKGDPVDVVTGRVFTDPHTDLEIFGPLGLRVMRSYSSAARGRDVGVGFGWTHSLAWSIEVQRRTLRLWTDAGVALEFETFEDGGAALGPDGWVLTRDADGFILDDAAGCYYVFHHRVGETYYLSALRDAHGNRTTLTYQESRLETITDPAGRTVRVQRGPDGRIAALEVKNAPAQGRWVKLRTYAYSEQGDLTSTADAEGSTFRYEYQDHLLASRTDPEGLTFRFRYDDRGRCVETWGTYLDPERLGLAPEVATVLADGTNAKGIYHCKLEYGDDGYSEVADSMTVQRYFGNEFGKLDKAVSGGAVYTRTYDEHGNLLSFTNPLGATTSWVRDARGRPLRVVDPLGRMTVIERELDGQLRRVIDPSGGVTEVERSSGKLSWTDPIGAKFEVRIEPRGLITETIAPNGACTRSFYDSYGNLVRKVDALGAVTEWTHDYWGRCTAVRDALGVVESYAYNARGDRVAIYHPDGGVTRYHHDGNGDIVRIDHADGTSTRFTMGGLRKVCEIRRPNGEVTQLRYDREGRLVKVENARGDTYLLKYDTAGRLVQERTFVGLEKLYRYDQAGQLIADRTSAGETTEFEYDAAGQLVKRILPDGTQEMFEYDPCGHLITSDTAAGEFVYRRNEVGWVVEERQTVAGETVTVRRTYDLMGNPSLVATSLGHQMEVQRDLCGRATRVLLDSRTPIGLARDAIGREVARSLPEGGRVQTAYDVLGRIAQRWVMAPSAAPAIGPGEPAWVGPPPQGITVSEARRYSPTSELLETVDSLSGRRAFEYDSAGQILGIHADRGRQERYRYDAAGNVHEPDGEPRIYGTGNRLLRKGDTEYTWDEAGRLVAMRDPEGRTTRYRWNGLGLLASVERAGGTTIEFTYDPFARRVGKRVLAWLPGGSMREVSRTRFVWDGGVLLHERKRIAQDGAEPIVEERTYCFEEDRLAPLAHRDARIVGGDREEGPWYHYLNDEVGAPERLVGARGQVVCELERTAWGASVREGGATTTPLRFPGQYEDAETGLVYNRYRYFDPAIGRYISADPSGLEGGFNGFEYAANAPTRLVDPSGLMPFSAIKNAAGKDPSELPKRRDQPTDFPGKSATERKSPREKKDREGYVDDAITEAVKNAQRAKSEPVTGDTTCAEVDALHKMAHDIRKQGDEQRKRAGKPKMTNAEVREELQKRFKSGATISTKNDTGEGMAPCEMCAQIFRELGLHPSNIGEAKGGVIGPNKIDETDVNKMGKWDGKLTQNKEDKNSRSKRSATKPSSTPPFNGT